MNDINTPSVVNQVNVHSLLGKDQIVKRLTEKKDKQIFISPLLSSRQIQPASIDVRLGPDFLVIKTGKITHLDPLDDPQEVKREVQKYTDKYKILNERECFIIHPGEFLLGATLEYIKLPLDIAARLEGRSSWGRLGIAIHATAGYVDPGFNGHITFELKNMGKVPIPLYPGVRMAQLSFFELENHTPYKGKYNESYGVISSKYFDDPEYRFMRKAKAREEKIKDYEKEREADDEVDIR